MVGYVADLYGGVHGFAAGVLYGPVAQVGGPYTPGQDLVRGYTAWPGDAGETCLLLYGDGRVFFTHAPGAAGNWPAGDVSRQFVGMPSWPGWDIARGIAAIHAGRYTSGGLVVDGWGGLHAFADPSGVGVTPVVSSGPYWPGWDIVRGVAIMPHDRGGYVVDAWGGIHPFALNGVSPPPVGLTTWYTPGRETVRGIALLEDGTGGYVLDQHGQLHGFNVGTATPTAVPASPPTPYWSWDAARGVTISGPYVA
jgi:hypothetical protein